MGTNDMSKHEFCGESMMFDGEMVNKEDFSSSMFEGDEVPHCPRGSEEVYEKTGTSGKSEYRHAAEREAFVRLRKLDPDYHETMLDRQMLSSGGVKGPGKSPHPDPRNILRFFQRQPLCDDFGLGEPSFLKGCFHAGKATSKTTVLGRRKSDGRGAWEFDMNTRQPALRRTLVSSPDFDPSDLSDPERLDEARELNHIRSRANEAIDGWKSMEGKPRGKTPVVPKGDVNRLNTYMTTVRELLGEAAKRLNIEQINTREEATAAYKEFEKVIKERGHTPIAEGNPHSFPVVPEGTEWLITHWLCNPKSIYALGLLLAAMHRHHLFTPFVGGNVTRGSGGLFEGRYVVRRQDRETGELILDCTITFRPHYGIVIDNPDSLCAAAWEAWKSCDVRDFVWTFEETKAILNGE